VLRKSGAAYIEAPVTGFLVPDKPDTAFQANLALAKACGLPIPVANYFLPGSLKSTGPQANHEAILNYCATAFARAKKVGIGIIVFGSSGSRSLPEGFDRSRAELQFVALLAKMAPLAKAAGVIVAVEPLNKGETNFIHTVPDGARLVEPVDHPNIRLIADLYHMLRMGEPPQHIWDARSLICHVHLAEKEERTPPGVAGDDFQPYFQVLKDAGYTGRISIECRWQDMEAQLPTAVHTLHQQLARVT
jgi:sugar phosphate isomerase/epimerase